MGSIGFDGGHSVYELGPSSDVAAFFKAVEKYAAIGERKQDYELITDRLYRRYLRQEELDGAAALMSEIRIVFSKVLKERFDLKEFDIDGAQTRLHLNQPTVAEIFSDYFENSRELKCRPNHFLRDSKFINQSEY